MSPAVERIQYLWAAVHIHDTQLKIVWISKNHNKNSVENKSPSIAHGSLFSALLLQVWGYCRYIWNAEIKLVHPSEGGYCGYNECIMKDRCLSNQAYCCRRTNLHRMQVVIMGGRIAISQNRRIACRQTVHQSIRYWRSEHPQISYHIVSWIIL